MLGEDGKRERRAWLYVIVHWVPVEESLTNKEKKGVAARAVVSAQYIAYD